MEKQQEEEERDEEEDDDDDDDDESDIMAMGDITRCACMTVQRRGKTEGQTERKNKKTNDTHECLLVICKRMRQL
jgi:hypothetical protein